MMRGLSDGEIDLAHGIAIPSRAANRSRPFKFLGTVKPDMPRIRTSRTLRETVDPRDETVTPTMEISQASSRSLS